MDFKKLLLAKKAGELSEAQIKNFVYAVKNGAVTDKQILEFVKLSNEVGCSDLEVYYMAKHMAKAGTMLNVNKTLGFCVDKHSAGSVSDGMSLVLMSVLASLNFKFVRVVSNTYGIHGSLLNKLSKFKGFNAILSTEEMLEKASQCSVGIIENQGDIAPVAAKMYNICKQNNLMVEPVVSASIMANKIATGASMLVVDVKSGEGSVVESQSVALANRLVSVGNMANIKTVSVVTDFNWPILASVGVGLELQEIKDTLSNAKEYIGSNILKLAKEMTTCVLIASGAANGRAKAAEMFNEVIASGKAYHHFCNIIQTYVRCSPIHGVEHFLFFFADRYTADGVPVEIQIHHGFDRPFPEIFEHTALHDAEHLLTVIQRLIPGHIRPAQSDLQRFFRIFMSAGIRRTFIERHHDIAVQIPLDPDGFTGAEKKARSIDMRGKFHTVRLHLPEFGKAEHLKSAAVCQDRMLPVFKLMQTARPGYEFISRTQKKMISIAQNDLGAQLFQFPGRHGFHSGSGPHRHKYRRPDHTVGGRQQTESCP